MGGFIITTKEEQEQMRKIAGYDSMDALFHDVPEEIYLTQPLSIETGKSECEVAECIKRIAGKNQIFSSIFRGAGAYHHYIPAIVKSVITKESLVTAYTPYQPEISQGVLQAMFEYQTMMCELTGMDVSNAGVYDGAQAAAEAVGMCRDKKHDQVLVSSCAPPDVIKTIKTYCTGNGTKVAMIPKQGYETKPEQVKELLTDQTCAVYLQYPNYYGSIEEIARIAELVHQTKAKLILGVNPMALALLKTPKELDADIAVGEAQPLGLPMSYGGPYLGFMTCNMELLRRLPGRIVGETTDHDGKRGYVLTLQAREQHIRREKASSNICSNEALCALAVSTYLAAVGSEGLKKAASQSVSNAHYLAYLLEKAGYEVMNGSEFFHEFVTGCGGQAINLVRALEKRGILGGFEIATDRLLWCCTELNTKQEIELAAQIAREVMSGE